MLEVGQEFADGKIVIASAYDNGDVKVVFPSIIFPGVNPEPFNVRVSPSTTVGALEALLAALEALLPH